MNVSENAAILVVEDSPELNFALCEILQSYGYGVRSAQNGFEALELLRHETPNVILCDIMMPGMDGYTLLKHTRADMALRTLPFIFLTARTSTADQRRAKEIGIEDYLTKPIDSRDLVAAIENALQRSRIMHEEADRKLDELRNRIVGILQHEFRTPLTFVLGYAELLATTDESTLDLEELKLAAAAILHGGRRLQRLIEGFLLLAELQNRTLAQGDLGNINAWALWNDVRQDLTTEAEEASLEVEVSPQNKSLYVLGDDHLLSEALHRLLDNAIRYAKPQSSVINLSVESLPPYVGLRIQDQGKGISDELMAEIVRPFGQSAGDTRTSSGAGLSLALVQHIAHLHSGKLEVTSQAGEGSTFTLWLPASVEETG